MYVCICICIASVYVYNIICICAYACACTATWYYFNYLLERYFYYCRVKAEEGIITCYMDDPELPIYSQVSTPYGRHQLINILLAKNISQSKVCSTRPLTVTDNVTFIIDLDRVCFDDLKADDLGSWKPRGTKHTYFRFNDQGEVVYYTGTSRCKEAYDLIRCYYIHGTCSTFHRLIVSFEGIYNKSTILLTYIHQLEFLIWLFCIYSIIIIIIVNIDITTLQ